MLQNNIFHYQFPENITAAAEQIPHINLMPVYGLNVNSMIIHQTLVLTKRAAEVTWNLYLAENAASLLHFQRITEKLLFAINRDDSLMIHQKSVAGPSTIKPKLEKHRPVV